MITIDVRKYETGDVFLGEPWNEEIPLIEADTQFLDNDTETISIDGSVAAIMSCQVIWPGTATVSMLVNKQVKEAPLGFAKAVKTAIQTRVEVHNLFKMYAVIDSSQRRLLDWIEHLGFGEEYRMKQAGPDRQDMIGYSLIFEEG